MTSTTTLAPVGPTNEGAAPQTEAAPETNSNDDQEVTTVDGDGKANDACPSRKERARTVLERVLASRKLTLAESIARQWAFLGVMPGEAVEIQSLKAARPVLDRGDARPFNRYAFAASLQETMELLDGAETKHQAQGYYLVPNVIQPARVAEFSRGEWMAMTSTKDGDEGGTKDQHITHRRMFYIDVDPVREGATSKVSTTEAEFKSGRKAGIRIFLDLADALGDDRALAFLCSGNGVQVHVKLDRLPSTDELTRQIHRFLLVLSHLYGSSEIIIDESVWDPRRITPAAGTMKRKGGHSTERPWRRTSIAVPDEPRGLAQAELDTLTQAFEARLDDEQRAAVDTALAGSTATKVVDAPAVQKRERVTTDAGVSAWEEAYRRANKDVPIEDVAARLGWGIKCPECQAEPDGGTSVRFLPLKPDGRGNVIKCLHAGCGQKSWSPIKLVAKLRFGGTEKEHRRQALRWIGSEFGIQLPAARRTPSMPFSATRLTAYVPGIGVEVGGPEAEGEDPTGTGDDEAEVEPSPAAEVPAGEPTEEPPTHRPVTDLGNAERLVDRHGKDLRYSHARGKWYVWTGTHWAVDSSGTVNLHAVSTVRGIYAEAATAETADARAALGKWALKSESRDAVRSMVALAQCLPGIPVDPAQFDRDPWLLNVANGTIDLRTGKLREHRRDDLMTKIAPVTYDPAVRSDLWERCLTEWQPDVEVRSFLQRLIGYSITGVIRDHVFPVHYGSGRNGKGTFLHALRRVLGPYGGQPPTSILEEKRAESHPAEKVTLCGIRLAVVTETKDQCKLDVAWIKQATGGDAITARGMREDFWTFEPTHTIHLMTNYRPAINETKDAIWERVLLIPWTQSFAGNPDKTLLDRLATEEGPAILRWAVEGCLAWQREGVAPPESVRAATSAYRKDEDILGQFLAECCVTGDKEKVTRRDLRVAYESWCEERADMALDGKSFRQQLLERGIVDVPSMRSPGIPYPERGWGGIRLRRPDEEPGVRPKCKDDNVIPFPVPGIGIVRCEDVTAKGDPEDWDGAMDELMELL